MSGWVGLNLSHGITDPPPPHSTPHTLPMCLPLLCEVFYLPCPISAMGALSIFDEEIGKEAYISRMYLVYVCGIERSFEHLDAGGSAER